MISNVFKELLKRNTPRWFVLIIDIYIVINTFILSYLIRFNFSFNFDTSKFILQLPVVVIAALISFLMVGSYKGVIRHTGVRDSLNVILSSFLIFGLLIAVVMVNHQFKLIPEFTIPKSIIAIHFLLNVFTLIIIRFLYKELYTLLISGSSIEKRVLIYGAGEAGMLVHSLLKEDKKNRIQIVGFIDDDKRKAGNKLNGIRIYNSEKINKPFVEN